MHLTIRYCKKGKISKAVKEHIHKKIDYFSHYLEEDHPVHMVLASEKDGEHAEFSFHFHGHDVISKVIKETLYESIDEATARAKRQMDKILKKMKHRKGEPSIRGSQQTEVL